MYIDIFLYPEAPNRFDIVLRYGLPRRRKGWFPPDSEKPVVAGSLYESLVDRYGAVVGEHVFRQMFEERKGPFGEDAKYDPDKRSVARKIKRAGGIIPDPMVQLRRLVSPRGKARRT